MSEATAFDSMAVANGALLPTAARQGIVRAFGVPDGALQADADGWVTRDIPVFLRGAAKILPLAWWGAPDRGYNPYAEPSQIAAFGSRVQGAGHYHAGPWGLMDLSAERGDSIGSYLEALRAAGATKVGSWVYPEGFGVTLVWAGADELGTQSLAIHLVPLSWVSERDAESAFARIDVAWSWSDVVALYVARGDARNRDDG